MLILTLATLLSGFASSATPLGTERWIDTQMSALTAVFAENNRRLTVEQDAMARAILDAASAHGNAATKGTFALWIKARPVRGNTVLIEGIARVLWPHKTHVHHAVGEYARSPAQPRRFNTLGAILIIDDGSEGIIGMLEAFRLREKIASVVNDDHAFGVVLVVDAHDMLRKHGAPLPPHFRLLDLGRVIDECQAALGESPPAVPAE